MANAPTSEPRKFIIDTVFGDDNVVYSAPRPKRSFTPEEVDAVRAEAYAEGERSAKVRAEEAQAEALRHLAQAVFGALNTLAAVAHEHKAGAARLAMAAARKIADAALEAFPQAPLDNALESLAREVEAVPRLVARVAPDRVDAVQAALTQTAVKAGYPGQIVTRGDPGLAGAAFVLDWGDGSAAFDPEQAAARVSQALETALAAEALHPEPLLPASPEPPGKA